MSEGNRGVIYFLGSPDGIGLIKIGFSTDPLNRARSIMFSSPLPLEILAVCPGCVGTEYRFHARYADYHEYGEWFRRSDKIMADISALNEHTFDLNGLAQAPRDFLKSNEGYGWCAPHHNAKRLRFEGAAMIEKAWLGGVADPVRTLLDRWSAETVKLDTALRKLHKEGRTSDALIAIAEALDKANQRDILRKD